MITRFARNILTHRRQRNCQKREQPIDAAFDLSSEIKKPKHSINFSNVLKNYFRTKKIPQNGKIGFGKSAYHAYGLQFTELRLLLLKA